MGLDVTIHWDRTTDVWTFPIESVSQSEAGFELVHQSISLQPHWLIQGDREGRWSMQMKIDVVRRHQPALAASQIMSTQLTGLPLGYSHGNTAPSSIPQ
jgi:alpha-amylase